MRRDTVRLGCSRRKRLVVFNVVPVVFYSGLLHYVKSILTDRVVGIDRD